MFLGLAGQQLCFRMQLRQAKLEMKRSLRKGRGSRHIREFSFDEQAYATLDWEEENEFRYQGEMYDVVDVKKQNGLVLIKCIPDKKETQLLKEFKTATEKKQERDKNLAGKWISIYLAPVLEFPDIPVYFRNATLFQEYIAAIFCRPLNVFSPPPDCC
jgi:hypothetical protein